MRPWLSPGCNDLLPEPCPGPWLSWRSGWSRHPSPPAGTRTRTTRSAEVCGRLRLTYHSVEYLDGSNGISLNDISIDTLHIVLDHVLVQVAEGVRQASHQASVLHGGCVEAEEVVLTWLQQFWLSYWPEGFVLSPGVWLEQEVLLETWAGVETLREVWTEYEARRKLRRIQPEGEFSTTCCSSLGFSQVLSSAENNFSNYFDE